MGHGRRKGGLKSRPKRLFAGSERSHQLGLAAFALTFALGVYGAPKMVMGFPLTDVFSDDSYVSDFFRTGSRQFLDQCCAWLHSSSSVIRAEGGVCTLLQCTCRYSYYIDCTEALAVWSQRGSPFVAS